MTLLIGNYVPVNQIIREKMIEPVGRYHSWVIQVFSKETDDHSWGKLAQKISVALTFPFFYISLTIVYYIGKALESISRLDLKKRTFETPFDVGRQLHCQIENLRASENPAWRDEAIRLVRSSRQNTTFAELERLRGARVLEFETEKKLDAAQDNVFIPIWDFQRKQRVKMVYAQAIEIKKIYGDEYDVFLHAQASPWLVISYLVKELWRLNNPNVNVHHFKPLRAPCSTAKPGFLEKIYQTVSFSGGIEKYRDRWFQLLTLSDSDPKVREELLSVDAYFFNPSRYESALFFLSGNSNILENKDFIKSVAKQAISHFYPKISPKSASIYAKKVIHAIQDESFVCGNLFVICVPKNKTPPIHYRAHAFGRVCGCHPENEDREILEKIEQGVLDASTKCNSPFSAPTIPQYRLFLPGVKPDDGTHIFLLTSLSSERKRHVKEQIRRLAIQQHALLSELGSSSLV